MIKKSQYLRLCAVLLAPLLLLGWWISEKEIFLPHHGTISCTPMADDFVCIATLRERVQAMRMMEMNSAVTIEGKARIDFGIRQAVLAKHTQNPNDPGHPLEMQAIQKIGNREFLTLPPVAWSKYGNTNLLGDYRSCNFGPYPNKENLWGYTCLNSDGLEPGAFSFVDEDVNRKFQKLVHEVRTKSDAIARLSLRARIFSTLMPIGIFILLSIGFFALIKITRFVIGPQQEAA